ARRVHALLYDAPLGVGGDDEAMQIEIVAVLYGGTVDLRDQSAGLSQACRIDTGALAYPSQLVGRAARGASSPAADIDTELALDRGQPALQRAEHAGGDTRGVPVHAHHRAERLEPERVREAAQQLVPAVVVDDRLCDDAAERRHARGEPSGHTASMQGQVSVSAACRHAGSLTRVPATGP